MPTNIDLDAAEAFLGSHARLLDRRRFAALRGRGDAAGVLGALDGYRNADGGYGWGLEPDLRSADGQPAAAMHALAVIDEVATVTPRAAELCDWLEQTTLPDGGLPFALPIVDPAGCSPIWLGADPTTSSMQITTVVAAAAHRVARHDAAIAHHPWLARATRYCLDAIEAISPEPHAYEVAFAIQFLDAAGTGGLEVGHLVDRLVDHLAVDGTMAVAGGIDGETLHLLDVSPWPGTPSRAVLATSAVAADLDRLASGQQPDGGWTVDFATASPAAALEWRGHATVGAVAVLMANGALAAS